jgi:hypothetical protein
MMIASFDGFFEFSSRFQDQKKKRQLWLHFLMFSSTITRYNILRVQEETG